MNQINVYCILSMVIGKHNCDSEILPPTDITSKTSSPVRPLAKSQKTGESRHTLEFVLRPSEVCASKIVQAIDRFYLVSNRQRAWLFCKNTMKITE